MGDTDMNRVDLAEIVRQRGLGWPDFHPEDYCHRCGSRNAGSWSVDSDRFNAAVDALGLTNVTIICPSCFVYGHEKATGLRCSWQLVVGTPFHPIENARRDAVQWENAETRNGWETTDA